VALEDLAGERPDAVELVTEVEPDPVLESEVFDYELLPASFRRLRGVRKDVCHRDWVRQPFAASDPGDRGEHDGGVTTTGEADEARSPRESGKNSLLERGARVAGHILQTGGRVRLRAKDEAGDELEWTQLEG
jgi:hypothetical protein